jgi:tRNA-uridine 2-sulfurtransferase
LELLEKYNLNHFPTPGGGCMLTEPHYSARLRIFKNDRQFENTYLFYIARHARLFRLGQGKYLFVGRDEDDNTRLIEFKNQASLYIEALEIGGPTIAGIGLLNSEEIDFAKNLFSRYSRYKGKQKISFLLNGQQTELEPLDEALIYQQIKEFLIL